MHHYNVVLLAALAYTARAGMTCIMPHTSGADDTPGIVTAAQPCVKSLNDSTIVFSQGTTYNLWTPLSFSGLQGITFSFEGNISLSTNITAVERVVNNNSIYPGHWITISGNDVTFSGSTSQAGGWFLAHGENWWSQTNDSSQSGRPHWFRFSVNGLTIKDVKVLNPIAWVFSIAGSDVTMLRTFIDARSTNGFPFNTDAIDLSASNVYINDLEVHNGDDVINVAPPATNVTVTNVVASGTHGISVSCSSGTGGNYLFENVVISDSLIGARFKGALGTTCNLSDVTWRNFIIRNTSFPVHFIENYVDQEKPKTGSASIAAYASNFRWENITGSTGSMLGDGSCISNPCWYATLGQSPEKAIYLLCKDHDHCKNFQFSDIHLTTAGGEPAGEECTGLEGVAGLGISCTNSTITVEA